MQVKEPPVWKITASPEWDLIIWCTEINKYNNKCTPLSRVKLMCTKLINMPKNNIVECNNTLVKVTITEVTVLLKNTMNRETCIVTKTSYNKITG